MGGVILSEAKNLNRRSERGACVAMSRRQYSLRKDESQAAIAHAWLSSARGGKKGGLPWRQAALGD